MLNSLRKEADKSQLTNKSDSVRLPDESFDVASYAKFLDRENKDSADG